MEEKVFFTFKKNTPFTLAYLAIYNMKTRFRDSHDKSVWKNYTQLYIVTFYKCILIILS